MATDSVAAAEVDANVVAEQTDAPAAPAGADSVGEQVSGDASGPAVVVDLEANDVAAPVKEDDQSRLRVAWTDIEHVQHQVHADPGLLVVHVRHGTRSYRRLEAAAVGILNGALGADDRAQEVATSMDVDASPGDACAVGDGGSGGDSRGGGSSACDGAASASASASAAAAAATKLTTRRPKVSPITIELTKRSTHAGERRRLNNALLTFLRGVSKAFDLLSCDINVAECKFHLASLERQRHADRLAQGQTGGRVRWVVGADEGCESPAEDGLPAAAAVAVARQERRREIKQTDEVIFEAVVPSGRRTSSRLRKKTYNFADDGFRDLDDAIDLDGPGGDNPRAQERPGPPLASKLKVRAYLASDRRSLALFPGHGLFSFDCRTSSPGLLPSRGRLAALICAVCLTSPWFAFHSFV